MLRINTGFFIWIIIHINIFISTSVVFIEKKTDYFLEWNEYKDLHDLKFSGEADSFRSKIFSENLIFIEEFNNNQTYGFKLKMNKFGHLTNGEYLKYLANKINVTISKPLPLFSKITHYFPIPSIDYRKLGPVSEVKDQGNCGSCWAFSSTGSLEYQYYYKTENMSSFSEQQLIDCSISYGNDGCEGGLMENAFEYVKYNGIEETKYYKYVGKDGLCRSYTDNPKNLVVKSVRRIKSGSELLLQLAIWYYGPVSAAIDASDRSFRFYSEGVYWSNSCSNTNLNHAVVIVGIDKDPQKHYVIKNSWGTNWGMDGYMLLSRNQDNMCGIATYAMVPLINTI